MSSSVTAYQELLAAWRLQAKANPWLTRAFLTTLGLLLLLVFASALHGLEEQHRAHFRLANYGGLAGFAATSTGALLILFLGRVRPRLQDALLGFAAGMMLAASAFSLILPGLEAAGELLTSTGLASAVVVAGIAMGTLLMLGLDYFTPHTHESTGPCGPECQRIGGIWLFVFIALQPARRYGNWCFIRSWRFNCGPATDNRHSHPGHSEGFAVALARKPAD